MTGPQHHSHVVLPVHAKLHQAGGEAELQSSCTKVEGPGRVIATVEIAIKTQQRQLHFLYLYLLCLSLAVILKPAVVLTDI